MSTIPSHRGRKPSILDRLVDPKSTGTASTPGYSLQKMLEVIRRDLEQLLNTRQVVSGPPGLASSIYCYGLPDLSSLSIDTAEEREMIGHLLDRKIKFFEHRLRNVRTIIEVDDEDNPRNTKFRITATLAVEPFDKVAFQTVLDLTTGHYTIHNK